MKAQSLKALLKQYISTCVSKEKSKLSFSCDNKSYCYKRGRVLSEPYNRVNGPNIHGWGTTWKQVTLKKYVIHNKYTIYDIPLEFSFSDHFADPQKLNFIIHFLIQLPEKKNKSKIVTPNFIFVHDPITPLDKEDLNVQKAIVNAMSHNNYWNLKIYKFVQLLQQNS